MKILSTIVSESIAGFREMLFPEVCICCGSPTHADGNLMCPFCQDSAFDKAMPPSAKSCKGVILPNEIGFQFALWRYDKGGSLQKMMRMVKYGGMGRLGFEMGVIAGYSLKNSMIIHQLEQHHDQIVLLPVPLHPKKKRYRGYNQAQLIALGLAEVTGFPILSEDTVVRHKFTATQTGHSLNGRMSNLVEAFKVQKPMDLKDRLIIIVDDVFTTGATCFALTEVIKPVGIQSVGIVTIAMA
jgi:predicted amidophosphoribosyltransferase